MKYQNKPILIQEFCRVVFYDFNQLINSNSQLKSYHETANAFGMRVNNTAFVCLFVSSIYPPDSWDNVRR